MKARILLTSIIALITVAAVAAACGGDDGGGRTSSEIQVQKGLSVAAISGQSAVGGQTSDTAKAPSAGTVAGNLQEVQVASSGRGSSMSSEYAPAPQLQPGGNGITVLGYGSATANADSAILELMFGSGGMGGIKPMPMPYPQTEPGVPPTTPGQAQPITEADLQPVIDAIVAKGVARNDIELIGSSYYDPYSSSATLRVTVRSVDALDGISQAAKDAAAGLANIYLQNTSVSYAVSDCVALEKAAMLAAAEDAKTRGAAFAQALGVGLGPVTGASHYSYSPFGPSPCDAGGFRGLKGPYPMGGMPYAPGQPSQVQVVANVNVTYAIQ